MGDRNNEIAFAMDMVQKTCEQFQIGIVAREVKGQLMVVVQDARDGKEYYIRKK